MTSVLTCTENICFKTRSHLFLCNECVTKVKLNVQISELFAMKLTQDVMQIMQSFLFDISDCKVHVILQQASIM